MRKKGKIGGRGASLRVSEMSRVLILMARFFLGAKAPLGLAHVRQSETQKFIASK